MTAPSAGTGTPTIERFRGLLSAHIDAHDTYDLTPSVDATHDAHMWQHVGATETAMLDYVASLLSRIEQLQTAEQWLSTELKWLREERKEILALVPEETAPEFAPTPVVERIQRLRSRIERAEADTTLRHLQQVNDARAVRWLAGSRPWSLLEIAGEMCGEAGEAAMSGWIGELRITALDEIPDDEDHL